MKNDKEISFGRFYFFVLCVLRANR